MSDVDCFQLTDIGCVREHNEDAVGFWPHEDGILFAVADGLGGHNAGEVASTLALDVLAREMERAPGHWPVLKRLRRAVQEANLTIYQKGITVPELSRMGSTLTATAVVGGTLVTAHVGDCRLYLLRNGELTQLTKDHTWVWEQVQYGILSPEQARIHPRRNVLTRCLGHNLIVSIDTLRLDLQSDMAAIVRGAKPEPACRALIERARDAGGEDNLSVQIAAVLSCPVSTNNRRWWQRR